MPLNCHVIMTYFQNKNWLQITKPVEDNSYKITVERKKLASELCIFKESSSKEISSKLNLIKFSV